MRVLLLSQWYPPEPVKLIAELAESLRDLGHDVEVLTGYPNYPQGKLYPGYRMRFVQRETYQGVSLIRVPLYPQHNRSAAGRILNYLTFAVSAALVGVFVVKSPDVIYVYGSPYTTALPAWILGRVRRAPFVFNVQDLWPESLEVSGMLTNKLALGIVRFFARRLYARASRIVAISPGFRRRLLAEGVSGEKIEVVSNWVDVDYFAPREALRANMKFRVLFAGNLGPMQGLGTIVGAAELLRDRSDLEIIIAGDGVSLADVRAQAERAGLTSIHFLGRLPEAEMPELFATADALLVHLKPAELLDITIPHKIYAYMASGRPVIAAVRGDAATVVQEANAGIACEPGSAGALAEAIRRLTALPPDELARMGANGRRAAVEKYSRRHLAGRIERLLVEIVRASKRDYA